jgi:bifunctional non-homologous end joining protein LigD
LTLPQFQPMPLMRVREPFDSADWLFEVKYDGFRALAYLDGSCRLVSRKQNIYKSFGALSKALAEAVPETVVLDGEIVCLGEDGRPLFYDLLWRRREPYFYAFDILYANGRDLRRWPLPERKSLLRSIVPRQPSRLLYAEHVPARGAQLFQAACRMDLEGIVGKYQRGLYIPEATTWVKIKNPAYSQGEGRRELFEARAARGMTAEQGTR